MKYKSIIILAFIIMLFFLNNINSEDMYFSTRTTFSNSQFWERQINIHDKDYQRKVFTNFFSGSLGMQFEFIIWDNGKQRGSRIFFKHGIDLVFTGLHYAAAYNNNADNDKDYYPAIYSLDTNGGLFLMGLDWDFYFGGTIPRTNIIWGIGAIWNFIFPASSEKDISEFVEKWHFYAVPSILFGYDFVIPDTNFKITPQFRFGITCNPLVPDDVIEGTIPNDGNYQQYDLYSGPYFDFSVAFSFHKIKWK